VAHYQVFLKQRIVFFRDDDIAEFPESGRNTVFYLFFFDRELDDLLEASMRSSASGSSRTRILRRATATSSAIERAQPSMTTSFMPSSIPHKKGLWTGGKSPISMGAS
jgi:hypothetical protein